MDVSVAIDAPRPAADVFAWVEDLATYPRWLDIVRRAVPWSAGPSDSGPSTNGPDAWAVDLRARIGPLARSKRLRMVRTALVADRHVRFERAELDGRDHAPWVLDATVEPTESGSRLTMSLHYGGGLLAPVLERLLSDEIERSRARLLTCLGEPPP